MVAEPGGVDSGECLVEDRERVCLAQLCEHELCALGHLLMTIPETIGTLSDYDLCLSLAACARGERDRGNGDDAFCFALLRRYSLQPMMTSPSHRVHLQPQGIRDFPSLS